MGHDEYHHVHSAEDQKVVINRISRAVGHLESIKRMVEKDRDCSDVLIQLSAVRSAITNVSKLIMRHHIEHCVIDAVHSGEFDRINDFKNAIERFIK
ncbi:MAG: metal-sensing transcriptional repressor [Synergistaceae bacterium]|nr:metal-sensing transcriptional repressor [Synergistaceae bacterium]